MIVELRSPEHPPPHAAVRWIVCLVVVLVAAALAYRYSTRLEEDIARQRDTVKEWDDRITLIKADIPAYTAMREQTKDLHELIAFMGGLAKSDSSLVHVLTAVEQARPKAVAVTQLKVEATLVEVTASSSEPPALAAFQKALSRSYKLRAGSSRGQLRLEIQRDQE